MPEWSIGAVSKTVERSAFQGFESLSLRKIEMLSKMTAFFFVVLKRFSYLCGVNY